MNRNIAFLFLKSVLADGVNFIFVLWGQDWNKREVIYSSLIGTTLPLLPYLCIEGVISRFLSIDVTRNRCGPRCRRILFKVRNTADNGIDDILLACEHVLLWIYGVSLSLRNTCRAAVHVESTSLLMVSGSRIRSDVQDLLGALFFLTVTFLSALESVNWNGNYPVKKVNKESFFLKKKSDLSLTSD